MGGGRSRRGGDLGRGGGRGEGVGGVEGRGEWEGGFSWEGALGGGTYLLNWIGSNLGNDQYLLRVGFDYIRSLIQIAPLHPPLTTRLRNSYP